MRMAPGGRILRMSGRAVVARLSGRVARSGGPARRAVCCRRGQVREIGRCCRPALVEETGRASLLVSVQAIGPAFRPALVAATVRCRFRAMSGATAQTLRRVPVPATGRSRFRGTAEATGRTFRRVLVPVTGPAFRRVSVRRRGRLRHPSSGRRIDRMSPARRSPARPRCGVRPRSHGPPLTVPRRLHDRPSPDRLPPGPRLARPFPEVEGVADEAAVGALADAAERPASGQTAPPGDRTCFISITIVLCDGDRAGDGRFAIG